MSAKDRTTTNVTQKATEYAQKISENGMIFVYNRDGVYWLAIRVHDARGYRTLRAVGTDRTGIRALKHEIEVYFQDK